MDGVGLGLNRDFKNFRLIEVTLPRRRWTEQVRFVCQPDVRSISVDIGANCHSPHSHGPAGGNNAYGDLSPVCDEYFLDAGRRFHSSSTTVTPVPPSFHSPNRYDLIARLFFRNSVTFLRSAPVPFPWMISMR